MDEATGPSLARRAVVSRRLFFQHRIARPLWILGCLDLLLAVVFAIMPDDRVPESDQVTGIFTSQLVVAWLNVLVSAAILALVFNTYSVTQRELTFERQSRIGYLVVVKVAQILLDISLTAYPTFLRNLLGLSLAGLNVIQIGYALYVAQRNECVLECTTAHFDDLRRILRASTCCCALRIQRGPQICQTFRHCQYPAVDLSQLALVQVRCKPSSEFGEKFVRVPPQEIPLHRRPLLRPGCRVADAHDVPTTASWPRNGRNCDGTCVYNF